MGHAAGIVTILTVAGTPTVPDWMQAWGTVAGVVFSALAFGAAVGLLWHEISTRRRDDTDRLAGQARMVLVSVLDAHGNSEGGGLVHMVSIQVRNHSARPIIDVDVQARRLLDGDSSEEDELEFEAESIEAGRSDSELWPLRTPLRWTQEKPLASFFKTRVAFTDAEGLRWIREGREEPRRQLSGGFR